MHKKLFKNTICAFILVFYSQISFCQIKENSEKTKDISVQLKEWLPKGKTRIEIMDDCLRGFDDFPAKNAHKMILVFKYAEAYEKNKEWFNEQDKLKPQNQPIPYNPIMGLTYKEYREMNDMEFKAIDKIKITIVHKNDQIFFKTNNKFQLIDSISVNLINNTLRFGNRTINFSTTIQKTDEKNRFKSQWIGINWSYKVPEVLNIKDFSDLDTMRFENYDILIGKILKTNTTFVNFKCSEQQNNINTRNESFLIFLN